MKKQFSHTEIIENLKQHLLPNFHDINEFETLFPENELQMEMYNEIAPNFFLQVNKLYFDKFILSISRLLDPAKQSKNENLSILQLIDIANETNYPEINLLRQKISEIKDNAQSIVKLRSKFIAHRDLSHSINNDLNVEPIEFEKIKNIFTQMAECINLVESHLDLPKSFFYFIRDQHGAFALVRHLQNSLIYRDFRKSTENWQKDEERAKTSKYYSLE